MGLCSSAPKTPAPPPAPPIPKQVIMKPESDPLRQSLREMREIRKGVKVEKENKELKSEGKATQCKECGHIMPHITTRNCTCHADCCPNYNGNSSCTIFRKISRLSTTSRSEECSMQSN